MVLFDFRNYGCGAVYPEAVEGCTVLDLGSGAGIDCFVMSKLVGPKGHVTGIDMTKEQVRESSDLFCITSLFIVLNLDILNYLIDRLNSVLLCDEVNFNHMTVHLVLHMISHDLIRPISTFPWHAHDA